MSDPNSKPVKAKDIEARWKNMVRSRSSGGVEAESAAASGIFATNGQKPAELSPATPPPKPETKSPAFPVTVSTEPRRTSSGPRPPHNFGPRLCSETKEGKDLIIAMGHLTSKIRQFEPTPQALDFLIMLKGVLDQANETLVYINDHKNEPLPITELSLAPIKAPNRTQPSNPEPIETQPTPVASQTQPEPIKSPPPAVEPISPVVATPVEEPRPEPTIVPVVRLSQPPPIEKPTEPKAPEPQPAEPEPESTPEIPATVFRPSLSELDEKRRQLEQRRRQVEQEKREVAALKKKEAEAHEKRLKQEEEARQASAKAKADEERRLKQEEINRVKQERATRRASSICRDLQGFRITQKVVTASFGEFGSPKDFQILLNLLNTSLSHDTSFEPLVLTASAERNFECLSSGSIVSKFVNVIKAGSIDSQLIQRSETGGTMAKVELWSACLRFLEQHGVVCLEEPAKLAAGEGEPLLKITWELTRILLENQIKKLTKTLDELFLSVEDPIETILIEWVNLLIPTETPATNLTTDFANCYFYSHLCGLLLGTDLDLANDPDEKKRAQTIVSYLEDLELGPLITADAILNGFYWANFICLSKLFLHTNG